MVVRVPVNPDVVRWAAEQAHDSADLLERDPKIREWISGDSQPTWRQLRRFASRVGTPYGYFLLDRIPERSLPIVDFRDGFAGGVTVSPELHEVINTCLRRQNWYQETAKEYGYAETEVVGIAGNWTTRQTADHMRQILSFEVNERHGSVEDQRNALIAAFEAIGGLAMFNSMVGDNTHRKLDPEEFRGFSLVSRMAPLVFVNAGQTMNGQLFTFAHELAHVWRGIGALGNQTLGEPSGNATEQWCNEVAAEFLVPSEHLKAQLIDRTVSPSYSEDLIELIEELSRIYRCGTLVILAGLKRIGKVSRSDFSELYGQELDRLKSIIALQRQVSSGGNINYIRRFRIGESFSRAVIRELNAGKLQPMYALSLTGIKSMNSLEHYAEFIRARS